MKIFRIPLVIVLVVVGGGTFDAGAQTVTILHSFAGPPSDGNYPEAGLVQGSDGNFYGTTSQRVFNPPNNSGTVFRISSSGNYSNLYTFGSSSDDGAYPYAGLMQASDGNFYGTTYEGGNNNFGAVFRISPSGNETNLYSFGNGFDGANPAAALIQGSDGNLYGTTARGGTTAYYSDEGTVFRISLSGSETFLVAFGVGPNDGRVPVGGLVQGTDGNLYGTTGSGGTISFGGYTYGTVFRVSSTPYGTNTTVHSFVGAPSDGSAPEGGLVQGSDGNFYGTTTYGGTYGGEYSGGTVFRISPSGTYTTLYSFGSSPKDGTGPEASLVQGSDGNFYGTTAYGGATNYNANCNCNGFGTVFRISPSGTYTTLYSFGSSPTDGNEPWAGLVQGSDGNFYGTTEYGGSNTNCYSGCGTVFKLTVPLNPPANQISGIQFFDVFDSTDVAVQIPSVAGETYQLQYTDSMNPTNWFDAGDTVTSIGGPLILPDFAESLPPQRFYRAVITP